MAAVRACQAVFRLSCFCVDFKFLTFPLCSLCNRRIAMTILWLNLCALCKWKCQLTDDVVGFTELWTPEITADVVSVDRHSTEIQVHVVVDGIGTVRENLLQRNFSARPVEADLFGVNFILQVKVEVRRVRQNHLQSNRIVTSRMSAHCDVWRGGWSRGEAVSSQKDYMWQEMSTRYAVMNYNRTRAS